MKKLFIFILLTSFLACSKDGDSGGTENPPPNNGGGNNNTDCGSYLGYTLYKDNEGCYYNGANYSKVYVGSDKCACN